MNKRFSFLPAWFPEVLSLEWRKLLTYRTDFWVGFLGSIIAHLFVAYFLWKSVFHYRQVQTIGGFTFQAMMFYYLLVPTVDRIVRGLEMSYISAEIYDGSLSRYLIYPFSFYGYKFTGQFALSLFSSLQLLLAFALFYVLFGPAPDLHFYFPHFLMGLFAALCASYLYFAMGSVLEMVAFWADNVWSLLVMLRFSISLLGGGFIPLALFPDWARSILHILPFPYLLSFPIRTILGQVTWLEWAQGLLMIGFWSMIFTGISKLVWHKGIRQYSGVGI